MGVYLLNNLRLDGTWLTYSWEEVRASSAASRELSWSWDLPQVPGKWPVFSASRMACLSPCSPRKEGPDKISLDEKCGRVLCVTASARCLLAVGSAGSSLSDTVTIRQACPETLRDVLHGIVLQCFSSLPISSCSAFLSSYLCTEKLKDFFSALQFVSECLGAQLLLFKDLTGKPPTSLNP